MRRVELIKSLVRLICRLIVFSTRAPYGKVFHLDFSQHSMTSDECFRFVAASAYSEQREFTGNDPPGGSSSGPSVNFSVSRLVYAPRNVELLLLCDWLIAHKEYKKNVRLKIKKTTFNLIPSPCTRHQLASVVLHK